MSKISVYKNDQYILSFPEGDVVYLDLEINIEKKSESEFELTIIRCQVSKTHMSFAAWLIDHLDADRLEKVFNKIHALLKEELQPSLFSYYYNGIVND